MMIITLKTPSMLLLALKELTALTAEVLMLLSTSPRCVNIVMVFHEMRITCVMHPSYPYFKHTIIHNH